MKPARMPNLPSLYPLLVLKALPHRFVWWWMTMHERSLDAICIFAVLAANRLKKLPRPQKLSEFTERKWYIS